MRRGLVAYDGLRQQPRIRQLARDAYRHLRTELAKHRGGDRAHQGIVKANHTKAKGAGVLALEPVGEMADRHAADEVVALAGHDVARNGLIT